MKQIAKSTMAIVMLLAVSACAQTNNTPNSVFSNYEYAPATSFNSYPTAQGYGDKYPPQQGALFRMNNHY